MFYKEMYEVVVGTKYVRVTSTEGLDLGITKIVIATGYDVWIYRPGPLASDEETIQLVRHFSCS
jgi:hypothetical protein